MTELDAPRRERFVAEYLEDYNATRAAIRAGYSAHTAYSAGARLLKDVGIRAAVERATGETMREALVGATYVVERAREIVERSLSDEEPDYRAGVSALALLAKREKEFSERHVVSGDPDAPLTIVRSTRTTT